MIILCTRFRINGLGILPTEQWNVWNGYYAIDLVDKLPEDWWAEVRPWYGDGFRQHVDAAYAKR
jgi:hypothetical protein